MSGGGGSGKEVWGGLIRVARLASAHGQCGKTTDCAEALTGEVGILRYTCSTNREERQEEVVFLPWLLIPS